MELLPLALLAVAACAAPRGNATPPPQEDSLEAELLEAVRQSRFDEVLDWRRQGARIAHAPNVDLAVIELDAQGRPRAVANVLQSRDYPQGQAVPIDARSLGTQAVRFTRWDLERWDGQKPWSDAPPEDELASGRADAPLRFMAPYPASMFKLMVAFAVLRHVDRGELSLDEPYHFWRDTDDKGERTVRDWVEPMLVESDNGATEALVKLLHERGWMEGLRRDFAELGLETLQVNGTSPVTGRSWNPGLIHMTALDTARLLLLVEGGPGVLWRTPTGREVTARELSDTSRAWFKALLAEQGHAHTLSSTLLCGDPHAQPGIPMAQPARWLAEDGTATVAGTAYGRDTRPCNAAAEVAFLHKPGLTENYASDGGIVHALPGKPPRDYIIVFLSNLGSRYYDADIAHTADFSDEDNGFPCLRTGLGNTPRIAGLGRRVDDILRRRARPSR